MPNWCSNTITISGSGLANILAKINGLNKDSTLFESLIGRDPSFVEAVPDKDSTGNFQNIFPDWYHHNMSYYGTKWDVPFGRDCDFSQQSEDTITLTFETAWSPPLPFCEKLRDQYNVTVICRYDEQGCDFYGQAMYSENGDDSDESYTYWEGFYHFEGDMFWDEVEESVKDAVDAGDDLDEFLITYQFLSEEEQSRIRDFWNEAEKEVD